MNCWLVSCCYFFQFLTLGTVCLFAFGTSAAVFLERAIQYIYQLLLYSIASFVVLFSLLFISVPYFNNGVFKNVCYFGRLESLLNEMHYHDLNDSYDSNELAGPGPSKMQFHQIKRHVIFMKSTTLTTCTSRSTRTTRTTRILAFTTQTSGEYWTCLLYLALALGSS